MQDDFELLRALKKRKRLSQAQISRLAKVSQPTVSRALRGLEVRHGAARARLLAYARKAMIGHSPRTHAAEEFVAAYERVVAKSTPLAKALTKILVALAGLDR